MKGNIEWEGVLIDIMKEKALCLKMKEFWNETASNCQAEKNKAKNQRTYLNKIVSF